MKLKKLVMTTAVGTVLALTGCASGQHIVTSDGTCLTCVNSLFTGKPVNYEATEHPNSSITAGDSVSTHDAFRAEAVQLVSTGFAYPKSVRGTTYTRGAFNDGLYVGHSSNTTFSTSISFRQALGIMSGSDMKNRGMSNSEITAALAEKPYRQDGDIYYMGGTFQGAAGPITAVIVLFTTDISGPTSYFGIKVLGYDKNYDSTRAASAGLYSTLLAAIDHNGAYSK